MVMQYDGNSDTWYDDGQPDYAAQQAAAAPTMDFAVQQPQAPEAAQSFAVQQAPAPQNVDWAAYTNAYPDLADAAARSGQDFGVFGQQHYAQYGAGEGRALPGQMLAAQEPAAQTPMAASVQLPDKAPQPGFSVWGANPNVTYGIGADGQRYFNGQVVSPETYNALVGADQKYDSGALANTFAVNPPAGAAPTGGVPSTFAVANDIWSQYAANDPGIQAEAAKLVGKDPRFQTPEDFYKWHYEHFGAKEGRNLIDTSGLSPAAQKYVNDMTGFMASQSGANTNAAPLDAYNPFRAGVTAQDIERMAASGTPLSNRFAVTTTAFTNGGDPRFVTATPGQNVRLVDSTTGKVVFSGTGPEAAAKAAEQASAISQNKGTKAAWTIETEDPSTGQWQAQANDQHDYSSPIMKAIAEFAAPLVLGALFPPLAGLGSALGIGGQLGTAVGRFGLQALANTGVGLASGEKFGEALGGGIKQGVLSAVTGNLLDRLPANNVIRQVANAPGKYVAQGVNAVTDFVPGMSEGLNFINSGLNTGIDTLGSINRPIVNAIGDAGRAVGGLRGELLGGVKGAIFGGAPAGSVDPAYVFASRPLLPSVPSINLFGGQSLSPVTGAGQGPVSTLEGVTAEAPRPGTPVPGITDLSGVTSEVPRQQPGVTDLSGVTSEVPRPQPGITDLSGVTSEAPRPQPGVPSLPSTPTVTTTSTTPPQTTPPPPPTTTTPPPEYPVPTPGIPGIGNTPTGGGGGGALSLADLRAQLSPKFRAKLPASRMRLGRRPVNMPLEDWLRYAINPRGVSPRGGEEAFFDYAVNPLMVPVEAAEGGHIRKFAVEGPGTGRSDDIPARLSDGEYVIDAETVALLGDGSSKAGAKKLDKMRVNVRKHKGRNLAAGRFSVNAKEPEDYLSGGRA